MSLRTRSLALAVLIGTVLTGAPLASADGRSTSGGAQAAPDVSAGTTAGLVAEDRPHAGPPYEFTTELVGQFAFIPLKDQAKALLQETEGLQLPNDLLLYAKTLSYLFALGAELAPDVDVLKLCLPYVLQFLAQKE